MPRENLNDLVAFIAVAREKNFTRAAAQLGVSQSALSHTIRGLESRLGVRLLMRTTRSVSATAAGEHLLRTVAPQFEEIEVELAALSELRDKPAGTLRITTAEHAAETILWPKLSSVLPRYPDIKIEVSIDYGLTDIAAQRFDAGIRLGDQVAKDMIAVRIAPDMPMAVVAAPAYFAQHAQPNTPHELPAPLLHQSPTADVRRSLCLGVRKRRTGTEGARRRPAGAQQHHPDSQRIPGGAWRGLRS